MENVWNYIELVKTYKEEIGGWGFDLSGSPENKIFTPVLLCGDGHRVYLYEDQYEIRMDGRVESLVKCKTCGWEEDVRLIDWTDPYSLLESE